MFIMIFENFINSFQGGLVHSGTCLIRVKYTPKLTKLFHARIWKNVIGEAQIGSAIKARYQTPIWSKWKRKITGTGSILSNERDIFSAINL